MPPTRDASMNISPILYCGFGRRAFDFLYRHALDLAIADLDARPAITTLDPASPADLSTNLIAQRLWSNPGAGESSHQLIGGHAVALGKSRDLLIHIIIIGYNIEFLFFFLAHYLIDFEVFIDQRCDRRASC